MRSLVGTLASLVLCLGSSQAWGLAIYTYEGNSFEFISDTTPPLGTYTTDMSVNGYFVVPDLLPANLPWGTDLSTSAVEAVLTDGRQTLMLSGGAGLVLRVATDSGGGITNWEFRLTELSTGNFDFVSTEYWFQALVSQFDDSAQFGGGDSAFVSLNPGAWSAVPEPSTGLLLAVGLAGLGLRWRSVVGVP